MHGSEKWGMCFCEGHERILQDCAVNYSCRKVPFRAHNPIGKAALVFLLDSPGVHAIDSGPICCFKSRPVNKISLKRLNSSTLRLLFF